MGADERWHLHGRNQNGRSMGKMRNGQHRHARWVRRQSILSEKREKESAWWHSGFCGGGGEGNFDVFIKDVFSSFLIDASTDWRKLLQRHISA